MTDYQTFTPNSVELRTRDLVIRHKVGQPMRFDYCATYDCALPQGWVDLVEERTGTSPVGHVVWLYPQGHLMGYPMPVTPIGMHVLGQLAAFAR